MMNRKVVVIDDDMENIAELKDNLAGSGYNPVIVDNDPSAIDKVAQSKPDIILMGLNMKHKSGLELAYKIKSMFKNRNIPVIAMSKYLKDGLGPLFKFCGIKKCLKKPFQPLNVIWAIENLIKKKRPDSQGSLKTGEKENAGR